MAVFKFIFVIIVSVIAYYILKEKQHFNKDDVQGLRVVVTGASGGIGREVARHLAEMGVRLLVTARTESKLQKVVEECEKLGSPDAFYISADMNEVESPEIVIKEALDKLGGIDMLVLNHVGGVYFTSYNDIEAMKKMFQSNTISYAHLSFLAMKSLTENKGRIVVVSSVDGSLGVPFLASYNSTKSALNGYFRSLDLELASNSSDVSVTLCHLGYIDTESGKKNTKNHPNLPASNAQECAIEIIRGAINRDKEIFFPRRIGFLITLHQIYPDILRNQLIVKSNN